MITSNTDIVLVSGGTKKYASPNIYCIPRMDYRADRILVLLQITETGSTSLINDEFTIATDKATLDAKTASGATNSAKFQNVVEQVVKDFLVSLNGSTTFTIV